MDINQLAMIKFLNALNHSNMNNKGNINNSGFDIFDSIFENLITSQQSSCQCHCHCHENQEHDKFNSLETVQGNINSNKIKNNNLHKPISKNLNFKNTKPIKPRIENKTLETIKTKIENVPKKMFQPLNPYSNSMDKAVSLIESKVGNKYVWGATGPDSFDCSGLVQYVYKNALGKNIPRTSYEQSKVGEPISRENLQVGDLLFFDTMGKGRVSHVGMYVGNNEFVHASNEKSGIKKSKLTGYYEKHYKCARRP